MNRVEALERLVNKSKWWGSINVSGWEYQDGQYIHTLHDPISIHDWNRAKIVPNTKVRILSPEHSKYVQKLAFEAGFKWQFGHNGKTKLIYECGLFVGAEKLTIETSTEDFDRKQLKEIFIELPASKESDINARILAEKTGSKHDQGKPLYNLIPVHAEAELVDVLTFGATKYAPDQWRSVPNAKERYTAAAMRHLAAYRMGESHDVESGKHHLAHAMCCLSFIIELDLEDNQ